MKGWNHWFITCAFLFHPFWAGAGRADQQTNIERKDTEEKMHILEKYETKIMTNETKKMKIHFDRRQISPIDRIEPSGKLYRLLISARALQNNFLL